MLLVPLFNDFLKIPSTLSVSFQREDIDPAQFLNVIQKTSLLIGMLACLRARRAFCTWHAFVLGVLACFTCSHTWRARVLYELGWVMCLVYFKKWRA